MINYSDEKRLEYADASDIKFVSCGIRENCMGHKYLKQNRDDYILALINSGKAVFNINGEYVELSENYFYCIHRRSDFTYITDANTPWSIIWIVVKGEKIEKILNDAGVTRSVPFIYVRNHEKLREIYYRIFRLINFTDISSKMECLSLMYRIFGIVAGEKEYNETSPYIQKAMDYIKEHYCEKTDIAVLSGVTGLAGNYFSKLFKANIGVSPSTYITGLKMEKARHLLENTDMKIEEIAYAVGISDPFYFSRIFRKAEGVSPMHYRMRFEEK